MRFPALVLVMALAPVALLGTKSASPRTDVATVFLAPVMDSVLASPLGRAWTPRSPALSAKDDARFRDPSCMDFRSDEDLVMLTSPVENWVHRCSTALAGGTLERRVHPLGDDPEPRWAVGFWSIGAATNPSGVDIADLHDALIGSLVARLGAGRELAAGAGLDGLGRVWLAGVWEFDTSTGVVRVYRADDGRFGDSLLVASWARDLIAEERDHWSAENPAGAEPMTNGSSTQERRREAATALGRGDTELQAALTSEPTSIAGLGAVRRGLLEAASIPAGDRRDLLQWACHLWIVSLGPLRDTIEVRRLEPALSPLGASLHSGNDSNYRSYQGSLLAPMLARTGRGRWADHAFADRLASGWDSAGTGAYQWDAYRFIISHGEPFLRRHRDSAAWRGVALLVAQSHETAWSLDLRGLGGAEPDAVRDLAAAERHRQRALALYRDLLGEPLPEVGIESAEWGFGQPFDAPTRTRDLRRRIRRLELGIDTGYRARVHFSC